MTEQQVDSFDAFFAASYVLVLRYAERRLPAAWLAEDVAAEVLTAAWKRWRTGDKVELPWLYRVAGNKVADHYRALSRKRVIEEALSRSIEEPALEMDMLDRLALKQALTRLGDRECEAIMLTYWEGLSAAEIAAVLGCSVASVWALLSRARRRLRGLLDDVPARTAFGVGGGDEHR